MGRCPRLWLGRPRSVAGPADSFDRGRRPRRRRSQRRHGEIFPLPSSSAPSSDFPGSPRHVQRRRFDRLYRRGESVERLGRLTRSLPQLQFFRVAVRDDMKGRRPRPCNAMSCSASLGASRLMALRLISCMKIEPSPSTTSSSLRFALGDRGEGRKDALAPRGGWTHQAFSALHRARCGAGFEVAGGRELPRPHWGPTLARERDWFLLLHHQHLLLFFFFCFFFF